ncbi:MAG: hypothetical protein ACOYNO_07575 [Saprospiraceae bacterium]|jgi:hypothetical protein
MLRVVLLYVTLLLASPCTRQTCAQRLHETDQAFTAKTDALIAQATQLDALDYVSQLKTLRLEEEKLFQEARACDFGEDMTNYNYWYRARLKFPSRLEQELRRLGAF